MSVIEAMCLGLPVVTTNVGGIPFLLKDSETALLVDAGAVSAMTTAVKALLEDPALKRRIVTKGRKYVEGFDWQCVKKQWKEILN